jgi:hypothetical protein
MAPKRALDLDVCPPPLAQRVQGEQHAVGVGGPAQSKTDAQQLLRGVLVGLVRQKTLHDFPVLCRLAVRNELAPLLDGPYNTRDTLLLRAETIQGRSLGTVLLLAAAVQQHGLAKLQAERARYDAEQTLPTRNWLGWARRVRRTSPLLAGLSAARWSTVRAAIFHEPHLVSCVCEPALAGRGDTESATHGSAEHGPTEHDSAEHDEHDSAEHDSLPDPTQEVVDCFQNHEDAVSLATLDDDYLTCDCCGVAWSKCRLEFYRCLRCTLELCAECEERRVNFK